MRIKISRLIIILLFGLLVSELFYIQIIRGKYYFALSTNNRVRVVPLSSYRGRIMDRYGVVMADNRRGYNLFVTPQDIKDKNELFKFLGKVLEVPVKDLTKRFENRKVAAFAPVVMAEDIGEEKVIMLEENKYLYPSISIEESYRRVYPLYQNSAHVLGYVGKISHSKLEDLKEYGFSPLSLIGYSGVEEYYDSVLRGVEGGIQIEVNSRGQQVRLLSHKNASQGKDISLTIDTKLQQKALEALGDHKGAVVVLDVASGEILSLVSSPSYNPNVFSNATQRDQLNQLFNDVSSPLINRAVRGSYPPGSVFKVPMAIAGLDTKKVNQHSSYVCNGVFLLGGSQFRCTHQHGLQDLVDAIAHSCNIYFYHLGLAMKVENISKYARLFGFGEDTLVDLPYESSGHIPGKFMPNSTKIRRWFGGETLNMVIGQGEILATPLQLTNMMATVVNNGLEVQPHLLLRAEAMPIQTNTFKKQIDIDPEIFEIVKIGLRKTVTDPEGTGNILNFSDLYVAGKTGTAQAGKNKEDHSWFAGYVKGKDKTYAFCIFLEHGGSSYNACVVARELLSFMQQEKII